MVKCKRLPPTADGATTPHYYCLVIVCRGATLSTTNSMPPLLANPSSNNGIPLNIHVTYKTTVLALNHLNQSSIALVRSSCLLYCCCVFFNHSITHLCGLYVQRTYVRYWRSNSLICCTNNARTCVIRTAHRGA